MGNHVKYSKRYPKRFTYFKPNGNKKEDYINSYDNSVRYNDYVLHFFLNALKKQNGESVFLMFSDHGESLFDSGKNVLNHGTVNPSQSEYNIPFIIWFSNMFIMNHYKKVNHVIANKNKSILLSDLFHAIPPLFNIYFAKLQPENNFFNTTYIEKKNRKVLNGAGKLLNYNTLKKGHAKLRSK